MVVPTMKESSCIQDRKVRVSHLEAVEGRTHHLRLHASHLETVEGRVPRVGHRSRLCAGKEPSKSVIDIRVATHTVEVNQRVRLQGLKQSLSNVPR